MTIGNVLREAFAVYLRSLSRFVLTAAAVFVFVDLLGAIAIDARGESRGVAVVWGVISLLVGVLGAFWVQGTLVATVQNIRSGKTDATIGDVYDSVRPRLPALIGAGIFGGVAIALGLVLFVVPGLLLLTRWSLVAPVIVIEGRPARQAFLRSMELVRGNGWTVFGVILATLLIAIVAHSILVSAFSFLPDFVANWAGGTLADSFVAPFVALSWTVMYFRLSEKQT